jgi:hypothetical protein
MAFVQNIVADRRRRIHARARGHGRRVRPGCIAVEYPSPSSGCDRTHADSAANRQRHAVAQPNTITSCGWRGGRSDRHPRSDGLRPSKGAALSSSDCNATEHPPNHTPNAEPTPVGDPHGRSYADPHC